MNLFAKIVGATAAVVSLSAFAQGDVAKGAEIYAQCVACHADKGNAESAEFPKLAGQHAAYLAKQLKEYKEGKRENAIMGGIASGLSPEDMANVSAYLASQKMVISGAKDAATLRAGEKIYRGGVAQRQISACAGCHSPNGAGIPALYPRLGGQHPEYIAAQLRAFRSGERANSAQMTDIASRMNDKEIDAVANYIAGLR